MRRMRLAMFLFVAPVLAGVLTVAGCSGSKEKEGGAEVETPSGGGDRMAAKSSGAKEEVASTGWGTLKGKVTFDGTPPEMTTLNMEKDKEVCTKGDTKDQTWKVGGSDHGVANVVVWLRAPKNHYFKIPDDKKKLDTKVKLDQPYCTFVPHVLAAYPTYFDGKKQVATGETLEIANSASITHNTNYGAASGSDSTAVPNGNPMLPAKSQQEEKNLKANSSERRTGGEQLMAFKCNIHPWMRAYGWIFDHPYFAITAGDQPGQDFGAYKIDKVPAGAEVELVYWHETMDKPKEYKKVTLKEGDNTIDFKISK